MKERFNVDAINRNHSCLDYMLSIGAKAKTKITPNKKWIHFLSPTRSEKDGSLAINTHRNIWIDFGGNKKSGDVISLVMECEGIDFVQACKFLENKPDRPIVIHKEEKEPPIKILYSGPVNSEWLIRYIKSRCVDVDVARRFCMQDRVEFTNSVTGEKYRRTYLSFINNRGGKEFRNKNSKISNSPKYYSTLNPEKNIVAVTEGFFSFLSLITVFGFNSDITYIVLNSASFVAYPDWTLYDKVLYYGDNDSTGNKCLSTISEKTTVVDMRDQYSGYKDLNNWLMYRKSPRYVSVMEKLSL